MELQFPKTEISCLRRLLWETKNEEQTQEIKLPESLPDIGKVLGAWGQPLIRSKEWRSGSMSISGGVMIWVMYQPEDGSEPRTVETWAPFQIRWDLPQTKRDGIMRVNCLLRSVDARTTSARKLMARAVVSVVGEALEQITVEISTPDSVPEDIQLLRRNYPVVLPKEAGEKAVSFDEELIVPPACGTPRKLLFCTMQPEPVDRKIMGDKVVFRGAVLLHGMVQCDDGSLKPLDMEVPFSQYAELEREYDSHAEPEVIFTVTGLETELQEDGKLRMKGGLVGQYVIHDRPVIEVVEDAYSNGRMVETTCQTLQLPVVLETRQQTVYAEQPLHSENAVQDVFFTAGQPVLQRQELSPVLEMSGGFQVLSGSAGPEETENLRWEWSGGYPVDGGVQVLASGRLTGRPYAADGTAHGTVCLDITAAGETQIPMVTELKLGEMIPQDPQRPSLILIRPGQESLWEIAKRCGSTVDAIREANGLQGDTHPEEILLVPVS